jgi:DNA adenine methylase
MQFTTPLRYPGGKGKLTDFIKLAFEQNELLDGHYVEPYAGGAGIALNLLLHGYASCIHLNDLNQSVYAFWYSVLHHHEDLCQMIRKADVTMAEWYRQKAVQRAQDKHSLLELGFSTFFLNRTNRSGIIWAGVIGGKEQSGDWKLDARFNKDDLIRRIETIALYRSRIQLYNLDAGELIATVLPCLPAQTLVYLDPPYFVKGQGLYENHYKPEDHLEIATMVMEEIDLPWIVSYDHAPEIVEMYAGCRSIQYGINYSAQDKYKGAEVMFFSDDLVIPDVANPAKLNAA